MLGTYTCIWRVHFQVVVPNQHVKPLPKRRILWYTVKLEFWFIISVAVSAIWNTTIIFCHVYKYSIWLCGNVGEVFACNGVPLTTPSALALATMAQVPARFQSGELPDGSHVHWSSDQPFHLIKYSLSYKTNAL